MYKIVGLSNILDRVSSQELTRGRPVERPHGPIIGAILVCSQLHTKIGERVKAVGVIKPTLIFTMRAFNLAVMPGRIGTDEFVSNP